MAFLRWVDLSDILAMLGLALLTYGVSVWSQAAAAVVLGVILFLLGVVKHLPRRVRRPDTIRK